MTDTREPPERIWLQNYYPTNAWDDAATWCAHPIGDDDVEYRRADLPRNDEVREAARVLLEDAEWYLDVSQDVESTERSRAYDALQSSTLALRAALTADTITPEETPNDHA